MTDFRTIIDIPEVERKISYKSRILSLGSCFSENIGDKFSRYKFNTLINPFGILYNPHSMAQSLQFLMKEKQFTADDLIENQGVWHSFYHHSRFSGIDKEQVLSQINTLIKKASDFLKSTNVLLLTFGTAWVYELKKTGQIVSNCHKVPAREFTRYRLSVCDIVDLYKGIIKALKNQNLDLQVVLTISPVRHLKDGFHENQLSKSALLTAVNDLVESFDKVYYFPSYEIMMDDLRDYRFYNSDMVHPSSLAIDYIWENFKRIHVDTNAESTMKQVDKILQASEHRPFQPQSNTYQEFVNKQLKQIEALQKKYPFMEFLKETDFFQSQLVGD